MKNSWKIYTKDMNNVIKNWVAALIIGGLIVLPSFYAWFNIIANWDPYGQTDQIPIGVVNEDTGADMRDESIDVGDKLVDTLKDNDDLDWHFTDHEDAMEKLEYGDYFAVIVIPENFSERLTTVTDSDPEKSEIEYYVNEKENAIAPKITESGASSIVDQITSKFISTVNGVIFDTFEDIGIELEEKLPDIRTFEDYVFTMEDELPEVHDLLSSGLDDTEDALTIIEKAQDKMPEAEETVDDGLETVNDTADLLKQAEDRLDDLSPKIEDDLQKAEGIAGDINALLQDAENQEIDFSKGRKLQQAVSERLSDASSRIEDVESSLEKLQTLNQNEQENPPQENDDTDEIINDALDRLNTLREALEEAQTNGDNITSFIEDKKQEVDTILADMKELSGDVENRVGDFLQDYQETMEPEVKQQISSAQQTLGNARDILTGIQSTIPEVEQVLNNTKEDIDEGQDYLTTVLNEYPYIRDKVDNLADRIRDVQDEADINEIIDLLRNDPEAERSFFEEPVKLNEHDVFPVQNYGTGMTPFYTILAVWVGGLLLISLLAADVHDREDLTGRDRYFGKLFTFVTFGLLQTLIVTLGDLFIVGVEVVHPVWFTLFGLFSGLVFMLIVFTLVSLFGDIGKAMVIVLLVLQIAGSGGTYPVEVLPEFFQFIHPFLPFTYAIDLMREAVGGIIWETVIYDIGILAAIGLGFLLLGTLFKNVLNKQTDRLTKKSREAGLFH